MLSRVSLCIHAGYCVIQATARVLQHHFDTQGTPVMIGGAAMAHTILGIDFNPDLGQIKCVSTYAITQNARLMSFSLRYLVLDPHYVGAEDIKTIQVRPPAHSRPL